LPLGLPLGLPLAPARARSPLLAHCIGRTRWKPALKPPSAGWRPGRPRRRARSRARPRPRPRPRSRPLPTFHVSAPWRHPGLLPISQVGPFPRRTNASLVLPMAGRARADQSRIAPLSPPRFPVVVGLHWLVPGLSLACPWLVPGLSLGLSLGLWLPWRGWCVPGLVVLHRPPQRCKEQKQNNERPRQRHDRRSGQRQTRHARRVARP
jgi:hypothetical protein